MDEKKEKKRGRRSLLRKILLIVGIVLGAVVLFAVGVILWLTITEYRPADRESLEVVQPEGKPDGGNLQAWAPLGEEIKLMTWNVGYGALGDNADFFMDGGSGVYTADEARVRENLDGMFSKMTEVAPDILLVQEIDIDCSRSYGIDETRQLHNVMCDKTGKDYQSVFAYNFKVKYVPYPIPPIGRVNSGIQMLSAYRILSAERVKLPCPFSWPVSVGNLKRCLTIQRIAVEGTGRELVIINLHLEAYDSGEGKIEQTKLLRSVLDEEIGRGNYVIAGGDFNQTFSNVDISKYPIDPDKWQCGTIDVKEFGEHCTFVTDAGKPTCRSLDTVYAGSDKDTFQYYVIDGYIVSDNIEVVSCETLDCGFVCSDHNPVTMTVRLKAVD
jgi:Metal-dependent hydrolase